MVNTHWMKVSRTLGVLLCWDKQEFRIGSPWIEKDAYIIVVQNFWLIKMQYNAKSESVAGIVSIFDHLLPSASTLAPIQEKPFRVRSVPESLEEAAEKSLETLRKKGVSEPDLMQALLNISMIQSMNIAIVRSFRYRYLGLNLY